jgi:hypothetical protein
MLLMSPYFVTAIARIFELLRDIVNNRVGSRYRLHQFYYELPFILPVTLLMHVMMMVDDRSLGDVMPVQYYIWSLLIETTICGFLGTEIARKASRVLSHWTDSLDHECYWFDKRSRRSTYRAYFNSTLLAPNDHRAHCETSLE